MRRVAVLDKEGAVRAVGISGLTILPLPVTRGFEMDSMLELVGRLDMGGAPIRPDGSGVVRPEGVGEGLVLVRRKPGLSV